MAAMKGWMTRLAGVALAGAACASAAQQPVEFVGLVPHGNVCELAVMGSRTGSDYDIIATGVMAETGECLVDVPVPVYFSRWALCSLASMVQQNPDVPARCTADLASGYDTVIFSAGIETLCKFACVVTPPLASP